MKNLSSLLAVLGIFLCAFFTTAQQNKLNFPDWQVGNGSVTGFNKYGGNANNVREVGSVPHSGAGNIVWKAVPGSVGGDGGWVSDRITIGSNDRYRYSLWVKKTNNSAGTVMFGLYAYDSATSTNKLNVTYQNGNTFNNPFNPYFIYDAYDLVPDDGQWYLIVSYVYGSQVTNFENDAGIYNTSNTRIYSNIKQFKLPSNASHILHRIHLVSTNNTSDVHYYWEPTVYSMNDQQPSVADLISGNTNNSTSVTGVSVTPGSASIEIGAQQQITASISPSNATNQSVSWISSNTSVANVSTSGLVTAVAEGNATITVTTADGGFTANTSISVTDSGNGGSNPSTLNNLLDLSTWVVGDDQLDNFSRNGLQSENVRETGIEDPRGNTNTVVWKSTNNDAPATGDADGGWNSKRIIDIDHTKTYRFSVWMKKTDSNDGITLFGPHTYLESNNNTTTTLNVDGSAATNPYFSGFTDPPNLNEWFLYVGYLHKSSYQDQGRSIGRIYDANGNEVRDLIDFKMSTTTTQFLHRAYHYYDKNGGTQYFFEPTIYEVDLNNEQPSIQDLVNGPNNDTGNTGGHWTKTDTNLHYSSGNVGIGTQNPLATSGSNYLLAVNGSIRAKEIKVETVWADYVFLNDYKLPTLQEVEQHIQENGHLINIPSAAEVKANGIELGEMNKLLLEKVEELMLYIIQQEKRIKSLEKSSK